MSESPDRRPRTWVPLVAAAAVGAVVLTGALVAFAVGGRAGASEAAVIAACEAAYADQGGPAVVSGVVYDPTEWRDFYAIVEAEGEVPTALSELPAEAVSEWESRVEAFRDTGSGDWAIVWMLDDESHAQCSVTVNDGAVAEDSATTGPLDAGALGPTG